MSRVKEVAAPQPATNLAHPMAVDEARDGNVAAAVDLAPGPGQAGRRADVRDQPVTDADRPRLDAILGDDLRVPNARAPRTP